MSLLRCHLLKHLMRRLGPSRRPRKHTRTRRRAHERVDTVLCQEPEPDATGVSLIFLFFFSFFNSSPFKSRRLEVEKAPLSRARTVPRARCVLVCHDSASAPRAAHRRQIAVPGPLNEIQYSAVIRRAAKEKVDGWREGEREGGKRRRRRGGGRRRHHVFAAEHPTPNPSLCTVTGSS